MTRSEFIRQALLRILSNGAPPGWTCLELAAYAERTAQALEALPGFKWEPELL